MKTLYLVRHAEASGPNTGVKDFDRPLLAGGKVNCSQLGEKLTRWMKPEIIISSPALRAKTTAIILAEAIGYPTSNMVFDERIYEAEPEDLLAVIRETDDTVGCAMLVGHNPALTYLVNELSDREITSMPTCSLIALQFPSTSWETIDEVVGNYWLSTNLGL